MTNKPVVLIKLFPFRLYKTEFGTDAGSGPEAGPSPEEENRQEDLDIIKLELQRHIREEMLETQGKMYSLDSVVRSDVQKYQQGEAQGVLTPEQLETMIVSSMERVMDKYSGHLQEKMDKYNEQVQEKRNKYNDHLQKYALLRSILYGVWTLCEFLFLSVHVSFIINNF